LQKWAQALLPGPPASRRTRLDVSRPLPRFRAVVERVTPMAALPRSIASTPLVARRRFNRAPSILAKVSNILLCMVVLLGGCQFWLPTRLREIEVAHPTPRRTGH
jgi:hypothetical protein